MDCLPFRPFGRARTAAVAASEGAPGQDGSAPTTAGVSPTTPRDAAGTMPGRLRRPGSRRSTASAAIGETRADAAGAARVEALLHPTPAPKPTPESIALAGALLTWVDGAVAPAERAQRHRAAADIQSAFDHSATSLVLRGLHDLPDCLHALSALKSLTLQQCRMRYLPTLPPALTHLEASELGLLALPDLPDSMIKLVVGGNRLTTLPRMPSGIVHLDVRHNRLTSLTAPGDFLPAGMRQLNASHNLLETLPRLPVALDELFVDHNALTQLSTLPPSLGWLGAAHNRLTSLPSMPRSLRMVYLSHNSLQDVPYSLGQIDMGFTIDIEHNPLLPEVLDRLAMQVQARTGHPLYLQLNLPLDSRERRRPFTILATGYLADEPPLSRAALLWYARDGVDPVTFQQRRTQWISASGQDAAQADGAHATANLCSFLQALTETEEYRDQFTRDAFCRRVTTLLDAIGEDAELRHQIAAIATEALGTCADRIATSLDQMTLACLTNQARRGTADRASLVENGLALFKNDLVERAAAAYMQAHPADELDEVEIQLAFRTRLGDVLGLPTATRATRYADGIRLHGDAVHKTHVAIEAALADPEQIARFLVEWGPWQAHLELAEPATMAQARRALEAAKLGLQQRLETALTHLESVSRKRGELSHAALTAQTAIAQLQREFDGLERRVLQPVRIDLTRRLAATLH